MKPLFSNQLSLLQHEQILMVFFVDKVDCVGEGKDICSKHGVSGYPTLKVFRNGAMEKDYDGPREASKSIKCLK